MKNKDADCIGPAFFLAFVGFVILVLFVAVPMVSG